MASESRGILDAMNVRHAVAFAFVLDRAMGEVEGTCHCAPQVEEISLMAVTGWCCHLDPSHQ
jgi:hypothetical protein